MKLYIKNDEIKPINKIILYKNGQQIFNPTEDLLLEDGWVEYIYVAPEPTEEEIFQEELDIVIYKISQYDSSSNVNGFYMGDTHMWLDKATRVGLMLRFQAEKEAGKEITTLWYNGVKYELNIDIAVVMLNTIELYASSCYDNTQYHLSVVNTIDSVEGLKSYDYTTGYPEKLRF